MKTVGEGTSQTIAEAGEGTYQKIEKGRRSNITEDSWRNKSKHWISQEKETDQNIEKGSLLNQSKCSRIQMNKPGNTEEGI